MLIGAVLLGISSCRLTPSGPPQATRALFLPPSQAGVLIIIADPNSGSAMRATAALVAATARPDERVIVLSYQGGTTLVSSQAPASPSILVPAPPVSLRLQATSFEKARYARAVRQYRNAILRDLASLRSRQREELASWAKSVVPKAGARPILQSEQNLSLSIALSAAASQLFSLRQAGLGYGARTVIAVMGVNGAAVRSPPSLTTGLQGSAVVVDNFPGSLDEQAAWQSILMQGGAVRAVILTPTNDDQLLSVVQQGLDGAVTDTLTSVLFGLGRFELRAAALSQMRKLLYLLTVTYPQATVTINGYTDNLPAPGGNLQLSLLRAQAVEAWLVSHGVAAGRLQAFGYGDTDPVAPNTSDGQPLNRRVLVVIDPAVSS
ncbi:MAG TPA: OmpA family protein [Streptosporangiaceae bacterium]|nr:OmpA family protein [Streptosporangiaceae bacterium]